MNDLITGVVCYAAQKAIAATEELTTNEHQWTPMKGVEISPYSCALVVRNLWLGAATRSSSIPALQSNRGLQSPAPPQPRGLRFLDDHELHGYHEFLICHFERSRGSLDITLNQ